MVELRTNLETDNVAASSAALAKKMLGCMNTD